MIDGATPFDYRVATHPVGVTTTGGTVPAFTPLTRAEGGSLAVTGGLGAPLLALGLLGLAVTGAWLLRRRSHAGA